MQRSGRCVRRQRDRQRRAVDVSAGDNSAQAVNYDVSGRPEQLRAEAQILDIFLGSRGEQAD